MNCIGQTIIQVNSSNHFSTICLQPKMKLTAIPSHIPDYTSTYYANFDNQHSQCNSVPQLASSTG